MNFQWLNSPEWATIVHALLHTLWEALAVAVLLGLALRNVSNPVARYRCALTALGAVVFAGLLTWAVLNRPVSPSNSEPVGPSAQPAVKSGSGVSPLIPSTPALASSVTSELTTTENHWTAWLALLWLAGTTMMIGRAVIQLSGAEQLRRAARPLDDERIAVLLAEARRAIGLTRRVQIAVTDKLTSPAVVGVIVPTLILPLSVITSLTPDQLRFVLLHELAHIRRGDYFASLFQLFAESLLFFNPAVWWISRHIRIEREACCDALAVGLSRAPAEYARTLVRVAETILTPLPRAALAFGEERQGSSLADRVQRMLVPGYRPKLRLTRRGIIVAVVAGGGLFFLSAIGTRLTVAALTPQQRIARIEKKMAEYGEKPGLDGQGNPEHVLVTARLKTPDGSPLPWQRSATVRSLNSRGSAINGVGLGQDGTIAMTMTSGQIWIEAEVAGFAPILAGPFDGSMTNRIDAGELPLSPGFDVSLRVNDATSGAPVRDAGLQAQFTSRDSGQSLDRTIKGHSDDAGLMLVPHCGDQRLHVTVNAPGYEIVEQDFEKLAADKTLEVKLHAGAVVSGTVLDKITGEGIPGATIRIMYEKGPAEMRYQWTDEMHWLARTDADGHFTANQLRRGTVYWLGVSAPGHESVFVEKVLPGAKDIMVKLGPELVIKGHFNGGLYALRNSNRAPSLYYNTSEVIENNSYGVGDWIRVDLFSSFVFTNRMAGRVTLSCGGYEESRDVRAPVADWVVDLSKTKANATEALPKREVVFRFTHPPGVVPRGTVKVEIPDDLEKNHLMAHYAGMEITNSEVRATIAIGGRTSIQPDQMVGYWFDRAGKDGSRASIEVTNGAGPMIIEIPLVPAGAIYAKARNADGSAAAGNFFGLEILKQAPGLDGNTMLGNGGDSISDNAPRKWVSGPLPLGGTYRIHTWRGNTFAVSKPIKLTEANPDAEVELQFTPGTTCDGVVLDADGKPLPGAQLAINFILPKDNNFGLSSLITDESGKFHLENATPDVGEYTAQVNAPGFAAEGVKLKFSSQPQTIRLRRGRSLAGRVIEAGTGYAVPGAKVRAADLDKEKYPDQDTVTDADGRFFFNTLGDVNYTFFVYETLFSPEKHFPDGSTNLVLAVKLYEWSQIKTVTPAPPPLDAQAKLH
jgi:beta-lactamase regulating signal transducer with metallopeptidase domain